MADLGISRSCAWSRRGRILGVWRMFWCPFPYTLCLVFRVTIKRNIVVLHIDDNQSLCKCYAIKIYNNKKSFQTGWGWGAGCAAPGSASVVLAFWSVMHLSPPAHGKTFLFPYLNESLETNWKEEYI